MKNVTIGGILLMIGVLIFLVTVYLEIQVGWIGSPNSQDPEFVPHFLKDNWDQLKSIWGWQAFAHFLFTLAYFLLTRIKRTVWILPIGSLWAIIFILSLPVLFSFGITLGAYETALVSYDTLPELFTTLRASVLGLYNFGGIFTPLFMTGILAAETFIKGGKVQKGLGIATLGILLLAFGLVGFKIIPGKMLGLVFFVIPAVLGFSYLRTSINKTF